MAGKSAFLLPGCESNVQEGLTNYKNTLPPLADPFLWWLYCRATFKKDTRNVLLTLNYWGIYEGLGDKLASTVAYDLFRIYDLPFSWANTLHEMFTSNDNWKRLAPFFDVPGCPELPLSRADALEVSSSSLKLTRGLYRFVKDRPAILFHWRTC